MDIHLEWNSDLVLTTNGSIQFATGWCQIRERIIRSVVTNAAQILSSGVTTPPDYIYDPGYGLGLGKLVSKNMSKAQIQQLTQAINQACLEDVNVDPGYLPVIAVIANNTSLVQINIQVQLVSGQIGIISLAAE